MTLQYNKGVFAFDVDDTLAIEGLPFPGPVELEDIAKLRAEKFITGICGNFQVLFKFFPDWYQYFSFYGPSKLLTPYPSASAYKHLLLKDIRDDIRADKYVMVGNRRGDTKARASAQDDVQAKLAGWTFINETDFAKGKR